MVRMNDSRTKENWNWWRGKWQDASITVTSWFSWSHLLPFASFLCWWLEMDRGRGQAGGGDHYSMPSWFSWSAPISSLASLPSLLLLLFLCLCLRWLSPSSLSCLLLLLLLIKGEGQRCGKGRGDWEVEERDQRGSKGQGGKEIKWGGRRGAKRQDNQWVKERQWEVKWSQKDGAAWSP